MVDRSFQPAGTAADRAVEECLARRTFHFSAFNDLAALVREKDRQGVRISLCLPTLNEEKTIGKEIVIFRSELMQRHALIDEIAVIDSGSDDRTREVAAEFGAQVYRSAEILPELGDWKGKGENLWKALYQLNGDIIVYVDADIRNIHARFVYGLVGPLLADTETHYVKAFYDRPLTSAKGVRTSGGGRVTEILVRPLFSLFFPELTALIQPLSGEYAVRRSVLERIPFPIGYGVETSHLIDVYREWGLRAFAQTDLGSRVHRNQSTAALGRMAFGILQTFFRRYPLDGAEAMAPALRAAVLRQFQAHDEVYEQVLHESRLLERPPMIGIPAYQAKFGRHPG